MRACRKVLQVLLAGGNQRAPSSTASTTTTTSQELLTTTTAPRRTLAALRWHRNLRQSRARSSKPRKRSSRSTWQRRRSSTGTWCVLSPFIACSARYDGVQSCSSSSSTLTGSLQATLETNLFHFETSYLTDSSSLTFGNIVKGYEAYVKAPPSTNVSDRRKKTGAGAGGNEISEGERVFSKSSGTYQKVPSPLFPRSHSHSHNARGRLSSSSRRRPSRQRRSKSR